MADYEEIPETIRTFLASERRSWNADLAEVAEAYAMLCKEANDRLRRCAEYLRRGFRSEAVQLSQCQPKLLPLVTALTLPDPAAWATACTANGAPPPPELLVDNLSQLESASSVERTLDPLLARHRLLSLAKAPLRSRIEVLVPLHEKDPGNPVWVENLRTLGAARLKEMRGEAKAAYVAKDPAPLEKLSAEMKAYAEYVEAPEDLRRGIERAIGGLRLEEAKNELRPLLAELREAHAAGDYERAAAPMERWRTVVEGRQVALPAALQEAIRPILSWISDEERRRSQEQKLKKMQPALAASEQVFRSSARRHRMLVGLILIGILIVLSAAVYLYLIYIKK
jgi:hypothetical protein